MPLSKLLDSELGCNFFWIIACVWIGEDGCWVSKIIVMVCKN